MLELKNISQKFGDKVVLKKINLNVEQGEILCIIGPSGCGKSTLLRAINFLEPAKSGEIIFNDKKVDSKTNFTAYRKNIGMVFQQFNLFNHLTVLENIILAPIKLELMSRQVAIKKANALLKTIGLQDKKDSYPHQLSGGQQQRIAIIRALIMSPELMLFDEPTSALDQEMIGEVTNLMRQIADAGMTMIVVSHELNFVKSFATKVAFMEDGRIVEEATPDELFNHPKDDRIKEFISKINDR